MGDWRMSLCGMVPAGLECVSALPLTRGLGKGERDIFELTLGAVPSPEAIARGSSRFCEKLNFG